MSSTGRTTARDPSAGALAAGSDLDTGVDAAGDALLAHVRGDVDASTDRRFQIFLEHLHLSASPVTVLDVSGLRSLSAPGVRALTRLHEEILIAGRELHVVCREGGPREVLDAAGIDHRRGGLRAVAAPTGAREGPRTPGAATAVPAPDRVFRLRRV